MPRPPPPAGRLDHDRVADLVGEGARRLDRRHARSGVPGTIGTPAASAILRAATLSPSASITSGVGPTNDDAGVAALARERRPLGQQAVARVDRVDVVPLGQLDDLVLGQVGGHRLQALADQVGLVGLVAVQVDAVLLREDRDRAEAELGAGAEDADGDLAAVGGEHAAEGCDCHRLQGQPAT